MHKSIGNLVITSFCSDIAEHVKFKWDLSQDDKVYDFVSIDIGNDLVKYELEDKNDDVIKFEHSYIVENDDKPVGYIYTKDLEHGVVELRYAVHPLYRRLNFIGYSDINRHGYGEQILRECSDYLFSFPDIKAIDLHIRKDNEASIGCAKKAKYKCIGSCEEEYYYIYRKSRGNDEN